MDDEIRICEACGIDFKTPARPKGGYAPKFCRTPRCRRDRRMEHHATYWEKMPKGADYPRPTGKDPTCITPQAYKMRRPKGAAHG